MEAAANAAITNLTEHEYPAVQHIREDAREWQYVLDGFGKTDQVCDQFYTATGIIPYVMYDRSKLSSKMGLPVKNVNQQFLRVCLDKADFRFAYGDDASDVGVESSFDSLMRRTTDLLKLRYKTYISEHGKVLPRVYVTNEVPKYGFGEINIGDMDKLLAFGDKVLMGTYKRN